MSCFRLVIIVVVVVVMVVAVALVVALDVVLGEVVVDVLEVVVVDVLGVVAGVEESSGEVEESSGILVEVSSLMSIAIPATRLAYTHTMTRLTSRLATAMNLVPALREKPQQELTARQCMVGRLVAGNSLL